MILSGGIASGKTMVSDRFGALSVEVIDTDVIAREVVEPGTSGLAAVVESFGEQVLGRDGGLDRARMRELIFSDPELRLRLEAILHPLILKAAQAAVSQSDGAYCLLVVPLLQAGGRYDWADRILIVDCPEELQIERVMKRDAVSRDQAEAILAAQISRQERLNLADDVIVNDGQPEDLDAAVAALDRKYRQLAENRM